MLTLEETKLFIRVCHVDDDANIQLLIAAATAATADYLNMAVTDLDVIAAGPVKAATLLMVVDLFLNRQRHGNETRYKNDTYERLLNPYRLRERRKESRWVRTAGKPHDN